MNEKYKNIEAYLVGLKKKIGLEKQLLKIHTLVLGSSHGQYSLTRGHAVPREEWL